MKLAAFFSILLILCVVLLKCDCDTRVRRLLKYDDACKQKPNATHTFFVSTPQQKEQSNFYGVQICQQSLQNRYCRRKSAVWRNKQCEYDFIGDISYVKCDLTPSQLAGSAYWLIRTFVIKMTLKVGPASTRRNLRLLQCEDKQQKN